MPDNNLGSMGFFRDSAPLNSLVNVEAWHNKSDMVINHPDIWSTTLNQPRRSSLYEMLLAQNELMAGGGVPAATVESPVIARIMANSSFGAFGSKFLWANHVIDSKLRKKYRIVELIKFYLNGRNRWFDLIANEGTLLEHLIEKYGGHKNPIKAAKSMIKNLRSDTIFQTTLKANRTFKNIKVTNIEPILDSKVFDTMVKLDNLLYGRALVGKLSVDPTLWIPVMSLIEKYVSDLAIQKRLVAKIKGRIRRFSKEEGLNFLELVLKYQLENLELVLATNWSEVSSMGFTVDPTNENLVKDLKVFVNEKISSKYPFLKDFRTSFPNKLDNLIKLEQTDVEINPSLVKFEEVVTKKYRIRLLDKSDPLAPFLGMVTDCCQSICNNTGKAITLEALKNPHYGFLVIEDLNGKILAQSMVWEHENGSIVLDSVESKYVNRGSKKARKKGQKIFKLVTKKIPKGFKTSYSNVYVGTESGVFELLREVSIKLTKSKRKHSDTDANVVIKL